MSFMETPRFPACVSLGAIGGPGWLTDIVRGETGQEVRNAARAQSLGEWEVSHLARRPEAWVPLRDFFMIVKGQWRGFRFKDYMDFEVAAGEGVFTMLTATTFQMYRRYTVGVLTHDRKIQKPVSNTVTVTGGVSPTVDYATGIVTVVSGTPTSWIGQFDVPVRFGVDELRQEAITRTSDGELLVDWQSIPIKEIRV